MDKQKREKLIRQILRQDVRLTMDMHALYEKESEHLVKLILDNLEFNNYNDYVVKTQKIISRKALNWLNFELLPIEGAEIRRLDGYTKA